ncbi:MAG: response regulator transcription factor [Sulfurospirillum sp.]
MKTKKANLLDILSDKKVLYAEDDEGIAKNTIEILEFFFQKVVGVTDGQEALKELENSSYDVLIFDVFMPHLDGIETIKKIRETDKKIPIVIISAHTEQEYLWRAIELKITKYLSKPCYKDTLIKTLEAVCLELADNKTNIKLHEQCTYNPCTKTIYINQKSNKLSTNESRLLEYFIKHPNQVVSYSSIYGYIWGLDTPSKEAIKFIIKELRKKIEKEMIENIYGVGYIFKTI